MQVIKKKKEVLSIIFSKSQLLNVFTDEQTTLSVITYLSEITPQNSCLLFSMSIVLAADDNFISERGPDTVNAKNNLVKRVVNNTGICLLFQILGISQQTWCLQTNKKEAGDRDRTQWIAGCIPPSSDKKQSVLFKIPVRQRLRLLHEIQSRHHP